MANITINGAPYTVKDGITIIEALDQLNIDVPRYCYHPALSIAGNCRICQVEVEKMPRTVIACNTRVAEGMAIHTQSEKAKESQAAVLEFLLANHPLDCPVCDQAGECKLQDYYMDYGLYDSKFDDVKVKKSKKAFPIGPTILLDQERCVLCTRCVRFADEITKTHEFGVFNRGDHSQLDVYPGRELNHNYSGNVADICPVGALTDRDFRFKMRVWYLGSQESVCPGCARGCNTAIHYEKSRPYHLKNERVMRLKPRENQDVNQWWLCDEGRYGYKPIDTNRIKHVRFLADGHSDAGSPESTWLAALEKIAGWLKRSGKKWALLASPQSTNEELFLQEQIFLDHLHWEAVGFFAAATQRKGDDFLLREDRNPNSAGASKILNRDNVSGDIAKILDNARRGEIEGVFIFGHDLATLYGNEVLNAFRKQVRTMIYEGPNDNPTAEIADVVLPGASYAEKDGTFTNFEGRVQRIRKVFEPLGNARPSWQTLLDLCSLLGLAPLGERPEKIFEKLAAEHEAFRGLDYKKIGHQGMVWNK